MKDLLTPDYMFGHYYEVTPAFLQGIGVRALLIDIDNTLAPYEQPQPDEQIERWFCSLRESGIVAALVSNNHAPRVDEFNRTLGLLAYPDSHKPCRKTPLRAMRELGVTEAETAVLGDQLLTDVLTGKRMGLRAIAVPPIKDKTNFFFRFKRLCERPFVRRYAKRHGCQSWMSFWRVCQPKARKEKNV